MNRHLKKTFPNRDNKFDSYKISSNILHKENDNEMDDYFLEEQQFKQKENLDGLKQFDKYEMENPSSEKRIALPMSESFAHGEEDFSDLWNEIQVLKKKEDKEKNFNFGRYDKEKNADESSYELSEGELIEWLEYCEKKESSKKHEEISNESDIQVIFTNESEGKDNQESQSSWESLNDYLNEVLGNDDEWPGTKSPCQIQICTQDQAQIDLNNEGQKSKGELKDESKFKQIREGKQESLLDFDPCAVDTSFFQIHEIHCKAQDILMTNNREAVGLVRDIQREILEEKNCQEENAHKKFLLKTHLLQYGKDFLVSDLQRFCKSPLRTLAHTYFAIFSYNYVKQSGSERAKPIFDHMLFPSTCQRFMEAEYPDLKRNGDNVIRTINVHLSLTREKVAVVERMVIPNSKEKKQVYEIRSFDQFEGKKMEYLGIIELKIGKFNEQWFCESVIYVPQCKLYCNKRSSKNWESYKMNLKLSENGVIVAELGIFQAKSSVTNCIIFGDNKQSHVMVATLKESQASTGYIVRSSGLSPLVCFVATISRKIFVNSD